MSFDKKEDISKPGTVELSDDALEGVSGGVTMTYDPKYILPEAGPKLPSNSTLGGTPSLQERLDATIGSLDLEQAIANTEEAENRVLVGPPKASISDPMLGNYLGLSQMGHIQK